MGRVGIGTALPGAKVDGWEKLEIGPSSASLALGERMATQPDTPMTAPDHRP